MSLLNINDGYAHVLVVFSLQTFPMSCSTFDIASHVQIAVDTLILKQPSSPEASEIAKYLMLTAVTQIQEISVIPSLELVMPVSAYRVYFKNAVRK